MRPDDDTVTGVLAYITATDYVRLCAADPTELLGRLLPMAPDGHLDYPTTTGVSVLRAGRIVRPTLFVGRSVDGRLASLCHDAAGLDEPAV